MMKTNKNKDKIYMKRKKPKVIQHLIQNNKTL